MTRSTKIRLLLLAVILLVFGQVALHDFVDWDDGVLIYNNDNIVNHTPAGLVHQWEPMNPDNHFMYNPMVFTLWWTIAHFSSIESPDLLGARLNPYLFHVANLVVHWLCACVVFEILRKFKCRDWAAAAGALIFAIHPLQTEAVAWASAMKDLLSSLFALLAIWRYMAAVEAHGRARKWNYWLSTLCFAAALLSKPSTVTVPVIVGVIDWIIYRRPWRKIALWTAPWYAMSLVIAFIAAAIQIIYLFLYPPLGACPLIAADALAFYLGKLVWPIPLKFDYGRNPSAIMHNPALHYPIYWTWIFPLILAVIIWRWGKRTIWVAAAIFVLGLLPVLGLKTFAYQFYTTVADRYVYLPMLGVALAAAWWLHQHHNRAITVATAVVIAIFGSLSFVQAQHWTDTETLYEHGLADAQPEHATIMGQYQDYQAVPYFKRAKQAELAGDYVSARTDLQKADALLERAMKYYRDAIHLSFTEVHAYDLLAKDQVQLGRIPDAIDTVKTWIQADRQVFREAREKPGRLQGMLGTLLLRNRQYPEAITALKKSLAETNDPDVAKTLAVAEKLAAQSSAATKPTSRP